MSDIPKYEDTAALDSNTPPSYDDTHPMEQASPRPAPEDQISQTEAGLRGGVQGLTLGLSDEALGAVGAASNLDQVVAADDSLGKLKSLYEQYRDIERQRNKLAEEAYPKTYMAGNVVGGVAGAPLTGALGVGLKGAALTGAVAGFGTSESEAPLQVAKDTAMGAGLGYAGGKIGEKISHYLNPAELEKKAAGNIANVVGAKGLPSQKEKIGRAVIESGALKNGVNEEAIGGIRQAANEAEEQLQPILSKITQKLANSTDNEIAASVGGDAGDKVRDLLYSQVEQIKDMSPEVSGLFHNQVAPVAEHYMGLLKEAGNDVGRLNQIKRAAYKEAEDLYSAIQGYYRSGQPIPKAFEDKAAMAKSIGETIKNHIESLGNLATDQLEKGTASDLGSQVAEMNSHLGGLVGARKALTSKLTKGDSDIKVSNGMEYVYHPKWAFVKDVLRNLGSDSVRTGKANLETKAAAALEKTIGDKAVPYAKQLGVSTLAAPAVQQAAEKLSGSPQSTSEELARRNPQIVSKSLYQQNDEELKNIADYLATEKGLDHIGHALNKAIAAKDTAAKNSALFSLAQNTKARKLLVEKGLIKE